METLIVRSARRAKEPVRLRAKRLSNGCESLYLDIYYDGNRSYEFLKMYLLPEINQLTKDQNKATYTAAEAIKAQRVIDLNNQKAGIRIKHKEKDITLREWLDQYLLLQEKKGIKSPMKFRCVANIISQYEANGNLKLKYIDKKWAKGFVEWLQKKYHKKNGKRLELSTILFYETQVAAIFNSAVRNEFLNENPFKRLSPEERVKKPEITREFLTPEELKRMIKTECRIQIVKQAFLFSCYCGLRISDILRLKHENIIFGQGNPMIVITMQKTSRPIYIPLSKKAMEWLPEKRKGEKVFEGLPALPTINRAIRKWSREAGIGKHVTFHTSRHTFGTLMITAGADLYTTSKLMGHTDVRTTQIYAKIVDSKKVEAVNLIDKLFGR